MSSSTIFDQIWSNIQLFTQASHTPHFAETPARSSTSSPVNLLDSYDGYSPVYGTDYLTGPQDDFDNGFIQREIKEMRNMEAQTESLIEDTRRLVEAINLFPLLNPNVSPSHAESVHSKWELPTREIPSGSRQGVGSLPGTIHEKDVAKTPEERSHEGTLWDLEAGDSHAVAPVTTELPNEEKPGDSHYAGVGSLPGTKREKGVAETPEERLHEGTLWAMEAGDSHLAIGPSSPELPIEEKPGPAHFYGVGSLPGTKREKGVAETPEERLHEGTLWAMEAGDSHLAIGPSPPELPIEEKPGPAHYYGVGSLPGMNCEQGVAVLPDERGQDSGDFKHRQATRGGWNRRRGVSVVAHIQERPRQQSINRPPRKAVPGSNAHVSDKATRASRLHDMDKSLKILRHEMAGIQDELNIAQEYLARMELLKNVAGSRRALEETSAAHSAAYLGEAAARVLRNAEAAFQQAQTQMSEFIGDNSYNKPGTVGVATSACAPSSGSSTRVQHGSEVERGREETPIYSSRVTEKTEHLITHELIEPASSPFKEK